MRTRIDPKRAKHDARLPKTRVLLAGATGLVGALAMQRLLSDGAQVCAPVRRALIQRHRRLVAPVLDLLAKEDQELFQLIKEFLRAPKGTSRVDCFVSCLGTTIRTAGSQAAFAAVDKDLVLRLARVARRLGAGHAVLVSSVGADPRARNFYLHTKGEAESGLTELGFTRVDILRPGLLLGTRSERRGAERLAQSLSALYNPLLAGPFARYRAIPAATVAGAIAALRNESARGQFVHEYDSLTALSRTRAP